MDNRHNKLFLSFSAFDKEFNLGNWLIDSFPDWFSFYPCSSNVKNYIKNLNNITFKALSNLSFSIVVSNASINNHIATSILHVHSHNKPVIKMIHKVVNVTTTKAKLFAIRCGINQAVDITNIDHIVIILNSLHTAKKIFDFLLYSY